jgi:hypothetical protein
LKLAEIREALVAVGCNTVAKQANTLGVGRATAWTFLNRDRRAGPSAKIIKRILSSPNLPPTVRRRVEEYIEEKIEGVYGHREVRRRGSPGSLLQARRKLIQLLSGSLYICCKRNPARLRPGGICGDS